MRFLKQLPIRQKLTIITMSASCLGLCVACVVFASLPQISSGPAFLRGLLLGATFLGSMAAAYGVAVWLNPVISSPIAELAKVAAQLGKTKDYTIRVGKTCDDEVGRLIDVFNEMVARIEKRDQELHTSRLHLEMRVAERIRDLVVENAERRRAEITLAQQFKLAALGAEVGMALTRQQDLATGLQFCAEAIQKCLGVALVGIWTLNDEKRLLELQASAGPPAELDATQKSVAVGEGKIGQIASERHPSLTNEARTGAAAASQDWASQQGLVAFAGCPLIVGEHVVGVIAMYSRQPLDPAVIKDLASIGDILALGIVRKHAELLLAYERDLLRTLLDCAPDRIYFKDARSRFTRCGKPVYERFGLNSPEEMIGKRDHDFFEEVHAQAALEDELTVMRTGQPMIGKIEKEVFKDGRERWALTTKGPLRNPAGEIIGIYGISKDITGLQEADGQPDEAKKEIVVALETIEENGECVEDDGSAQEVARGLATFGISPGNGTNFSFQTPNQPPQASP